MARAAMCEPRARSEGAAVGQAMRVGWCWMILGCANAPPPPSTPAPAGTVTRLTLPRAFVAQRSVTLRLNSARDAATLDTRLSLLRAPDAPETFTVRLRPPRVCGASDGALRELRVEVAEGAPVTAEVRDDAVALHVRADGAADHDVRGVYLHGAAGCAEGLAAGTQVPVHARLRVEASDDPGRPRIGGAARCRSGAFVGARTTVPLTLELLDAAQEPRSFANLSPLAPFEVRVDADLPVTVSRPGSLHLAERPGRVRLFAPGERDPWVWRWRVSPAEVTDATVRFYVPGNAGTPAEVTEGARLGGGNRKLGGVFFEVRGAAVGDGALCDPPDARWFQMTSETPEVCAAVAVNAQGCDGCVGPSYGHQAARLLRDGVCTVRVEAPALDHGRGIRRRVSAAFYGVENFAAVFPTAE